MSFSALAIRRNVLSMQAQVCEFVPFFSGLNRIGSYSRWTPKIQLLIDTFSVMSVICYYLVNRQPDSQLVKSLYVCIYVRVNCCSPPLQHSLLQPYVLALLPVFLQLIECVSMIVRGRGQ